MSKLTELMKSNILDRMMNNPNLFGETVRDYAFVKHKDYDYGCYSTFELLPEFKEVKEGELLDKLIDELNEGNDWDEGYTRQMFIQESRPQCFSNGEIHVAWYWDGDGTLLVVSEPDGRAAINTDCKKDYGWKKVKW